jgi:glutamate carboxypeptidase
MAVSVLDNSVDVAARAREWAERELPRMVTLLERLVAAESPSTEPSAQAEMFSLLAVELERLGFEVRALPGEEVGDHLLATPSGLADGEGSRQLLLGHLDTVWPLGTLAEMPVRIEHGRLHGPGTFDMKAGLTQLLFALSALREQGREPALAPVVFVNSDEEISSKESANHVDRLARTVERALVLEPSFGPRGMLKTARKGVGRFTVRISGKGGHAGLDPAGGSSAILEASHQIQRLFSLSDPERGISVNVGTIDGGLGANVIAAEVSAQVDVRAPTAADAEELEGAIRSLEPVEPDTSITIEGGFRRPPLEQTPRNRRLWELAEKIGAGFGLVLEQALVGGGSDGNIASTHTAVLDGLGGVGNGAHAAHEHVIIARMPERVALLAGLLSAPADTPDGRPS